MIGAGVFAAHGPSSAPGGAASGADRLLWRGTTRARAPGANLLRPHVSGGDEIYTRSAMRSRALWLEFCEEASAASFIRPACSDRRARRSLTPRAHAGRWPDAACVLKCFSPPNCNRGIRRWSSRPRPHLSRSGVCIEHAAPCRWWPMACEMASRFCRGVVLAPAAKALSASVCTSVPATPYVPMHLFACCPWLPSFSRLAGQAHRVTCQKPSSAFCRRSPFCAAGHAGMDRLPAIRAACTASPISKTAA